MSDSPSTDCSPATPPPAGADFIALVSHELRTPLTGILGMADLLNDTPLGAEQRRYLDTLRQCGDAMLALINDILDYTRIHRGEFTLESRPFRCGDLVQEIISVFTPMAAQRGNTLVCKAKIDHLPVLRGDPHRLRQVLFNLIGNANKFTSGGEIVLRVKARNHARDENEVVVLFEIQDSGIGIPEDALPRLFRPFQQGGKDTAYQFGGTGLGLSISQRLVQTMGGEISVMSVLGRGSVFLFSVCLPRADAAEVIEAPQPVLRRMAPLHILVAEDNPASRLLMSARLSREGHRITLAENGKDALTEATRGRYDLILMDMQMPEMDGNEATRAIRKLRGIRGRVPIIGLSADTLPELEAEHRRAGLDDYLTKPVDWGRLFDVLARYAGPENPPTLTPPPPQTDSSRAEALRVELGDEVFAELAKLFYESAQSELKRLHQAILKQDRETVHQAAHKIKGSASSIGYDDIAHLARTLEFGELHTWTPLADQLKKALRSRAP